MHFILESARFSTIPSRSDLGKWCLLGFYRVSLVRSTAKFKFWPWNEFSRSFWSKIIVGERECIFGYSRFHFRQKTCNNVKAYNAWSFVEWIVQLFQKLHNWHAWKVSDFGEIFYGFHSFFTRVKVSHLHECVATSWMTKMPSCHTFSESPGCILQWFQVFLSIF